MTESAERFETTTTSDRWEVVLPDDSIWSHTTKGLADAIEHERKQREWFTTMYAELILNGRDDPQLAPPAPAREIVHKRTTVTTITTVETLNIHVLDHSARTA